MPFTETRSPPLLAPMAGSTPAPFWLRAVALMLDTLFAGLAGMLILTRIVLPQTYSDSDLRLARQQQLWQAQTQQLESGVWPDWNADADELELRNTEIQTLFFALLAYFAGSEIFWAGRTLGKRVFGLRAARWGTGERPRWIESLSRCIIKSASLLCLPLLLADLIPVFLRPAHRALHDYLAHTIITGAALPPAPPARDED